MDQVKHNIKEDLKVGFERTPKLLPLDKLSSRLRTHSPMQEEFLSEKVQAGQIWILPNFSISILLKKVAIYGISSRCWFEFTWRLFERIIMHQPCSQVTFTYYFVIARLESNSSTMSGYNHDFSEQRFLKKRSSRTYLKLHSLLKRHWRSPDGLMVSKSNWMTMKTLSPNAT